MEGKDGRARADFFGSWMGRRWRKFKSRETGAIGWLKSKGLHSYAVYILALSLRLSLFFSLALLGALLALVVVIAYVSGKSFGRPEGNPAGWPAEEQEDHKKSVFYDPTSYSDSDDPRFDD